MTCMTKKRAVKTMNKSDYAAMLMDYLCDARTRAASAAKYTLAAVATIGNANELAGWGKKEPLSISQEA